MLNRRNLNPLILLAVSPLIASSCNDRDPLVDEMVRQQATHHETIARQGEELTKASRELVESDAKARRELAEHDAQLQVQRESERQNLDAQRDALETERREIAKQRHRDPLVAAALVQAATLLVAALPILLLILLVRAARNEPADVPLGDLLIHDLTAEEPLLLPAPLRHRPAVLLPPPEAPPLPGDKACPADEQPAPDPIP